MSTLPKPAPYSIREAARLCGLPESTLRYYETIGLLEPVGRDASSGHRRYTEDDVNRAVAVACLNATGMSIGAMRAYLENRAHGQRSAQEQVGLLEAHKRHLTEEAHNLHLRQRYIDAKIAYWQAIGAGDAAQAKAISAGARLLSSELRGVEDEAVVPDVVA